MRVTLRPNGKKSIYILLFLIFCYVFLAKRKYTETFEIVFETVEPKVVWEFWADFSNWKKLNPTVQGFEIEYERGTYENWEYAVAYWEHLNLFPFITNVNRGVFKVTPEKRVGHFTQPYRIDSSHSTCFYKLFCLYSDADMTFTATAAHGESKNQALKSPNTKVVEIVTYECPTILAALCRSDLRIQRDLIQKKALQIDFSADKDQ